MAYYTLFTLIGEKKMHEVIVMSKLVSDLARERKIEAIVDLGSGKGNCLSFKFKKSCLTKAQYLLPFENSAVNYFMLTALDYVDKFLKEQQTFELIELRFFNSGYLGQVLSAVFGLDVLAIEGSESNVEGARKREKNLEVR